MATIDERWHLNGLGAVVLSNEQVRMVVLPELGGKIYSFEHRPTSREWMWQNARIAPSRVPFGSNFDNNWSGGADVLYPTCIPARWAGEEIPDSGEWWSIPWQAATASDDSGVTLTLTAGGRVLPTVATRTFRLEADRPEVTLGFETVNVGNAPVPFLLGFHPALAVKAGSSIDLAPGSVEIEHASGPALGAPGLTYRWPHLVGGDGLERDMREVLPPRANVFAGHYFTPDAGDVWWALRDPDGGPGLALVAPGADFVGLWMWIVYGGWRGYHHLALEPWTSFPISLDEAVRKQTARWLEPGERFATELRMVAMQSPKPVTELSMATKGNEIGR